MEELTSEERIIRLEKLYEKFYHTYELLSIYVPKMCDFLEKYLRKTTEYRYDIQSDINNIRDLIKLIDNDMQEHLKVCYLNKGDAVVGEGSYEGIEVGDKK